MLTLHNKSMNITHIYFFSLQTSGVNIESYRWLTHRIFGVYIKVFGIRVDGYVMIWWLFCDVEDILVLVVFIIDSFIFYLSYPNITIIQSYQNLYNISYTSNTLLHYLHYHINISNTIHIATSITNLYYQPILQCLFNN